MTNPTVRIPKTLIPLVDKMAKDRGVAPSVLVGQAIRFYLSATDPSLVATTVAEALKPLAADLRHVKYILDKQQAVETKPAAISTSPERPIRSDTSETNGTNRREDIQERIEQKRQQAIDRLFHKPSSPITTEGTNP